MKGQNDASTGDQVHPGDVFVLTREDLDALIGAIGESGYEVIGPTVRDGAVMTGPISATSDLPVGRRDAQSPGHYRLEDEGDSMLFSWAVGPASWKGEFFPPAQEQWRATRHGDTYVFEVPDALRRPLAMFAIRPCDLVALRVLDRVFTGGEHVDRRYDDRRGATFVVVAECGSPADTCFCTSMESGPGARTGFDLSLTEVLDEAGHRFVVRVGTDAGGEMIARVPRRTARGTDEADRAGVLARASARMTRSIRTEGVAELLASSQGSSMWDDVAQRCLSCANCTMVCPTCFCSDVHDVSDVTGSVIRQRTWSSCFDLDHSYLHGGAVRASGASRYRQWMTHKLSTWWDQFGTSGCVGCGRCIVWCPVGIDITEEVSRCSAEQAPREVSGSK